MELFKFRAREESPRRQERLLGIKRSIETGLRFEEDAMSKPLDASTLKRVYNMESLWIDEGGNIKKLGSANYDRELDIFNNLKEKYVDLKSICVQRGNSKYHVVKRDDKTYLFSTPLELTNSDIYMMLSDIEGSLHRKKIFLSSNTNIRE